MKRFFFIFAILMAMVMVAPAYAETHHYVAKVYKQLNDKPGNLTEITSGITYKVLAIDSDTAETLGSDPAMTSKTNPVTTTVFNTQDRIDFYCDPTDATSDLYVDLIVTDTDGGYSVFVENFDPYQRSIVIDERPNILHHGIIWFDDADGASTDTGVDLNPDTMLTKVCVEVVTVDSGQVISIETADTSDGLIASQSLTTAGYYCNDKPTITAGTETYVSTASNVGSLMGSSLAGANSATDEGSHYLWSHIVTTAGTDDDIYFDTDASSGFAADGYIHYFFMRLR